MSVVDQSLTEAFRESIVKNTTDAGVDASEVVLDSFMEDGILREIPIVKYAISVYNVAKDIRGIFYLRKLKQFIDSFNEKTVSEEKVQKRREKFSGKNRDRELTYISIIVDQYLDFYKPAILAKLYLAYLDQIITWREFCTYAEVINKLTGYDIEFFLETDSYKMEGDDIPGELLRLIGAGLMNDFQQNSTFLPDGRGGFGLSMQQMRRVARKQRDFQRTSFGKKLAEIISSRK